MSLFHTKYLISSSSIISGNDWPILVFALGFLQWLLLSSCPLVGAFIPHTHSLQGSKSKKLIDWLFQSIYFSPFIYRFSLYHFLAIFWSTLIVPIWCWSKGYFIQRCGVKTTAPNWFKDGIPMIMLYDLMASITIYWKVTIFVFFSILNMVHKLACPQIHVCPFENWLVTLSTVVAFFSVFPFSCTRSSALCLPNSPSQYVPPS